MVGDCGFGVERDADVAGEPVLPDDTEHLALDVIGRYGSSVPKVEWGLAVGATIRFGN